MAPGILGWLRGRRSHNENGQAQKSGEAIEIAKVDGKGDGQRMRRTLTGIAAAAMTLGAMAPRENGIASRGNVRNISDFFALGSTEHTRKNRHTYIRGRRHTYDIERGDRVHHPKHKHAHGTVLEVRNGVAWVNWDKSELRSKGTMTFAHELTKM